AWGALVGGVLQVLFQVPFLARYLKGVVPSLGRGMAEVAVVVRNFVPIVAARGAVNLSSLLDLFLASLLTTAAVSAMTYAQTLYLLPISLFGMSVAASELPELSRDTTAGTAAVRKRAERGIATVLFWLVPSALGYIVFGPEVTGIVYQTGEFSAGDAEAVGMILGVYAIGLPASGTSRVLSSTFFALGDTRTPARIAYARIAVSAAVGASVMFPLDRFSVGGIAIGAAGLAAGASVGAWLELYLLRRCLRQRMKELSFGSRNVLRYLLVGGLATAAALLPATLLPPMHPIISGAAVVVLFAAVYLVVTTRLGVSPVRLRDLFRRPPPPGDGDSSGRGSEE
ncbi:MAG: murein biosynthesis integral membrane protein MurJ, partial [Gemmatimonadetes bacterium]|nr:murein biosynthesis integral membrane protein MurJ [Gemmatimonadota bacterium]